MAIGDFLGKLKRSPVLPQAGGRTAGQAEDAAAARQATRDRLLDLRQKLLVELKDRRVREKPLFQAHLRQLENPGNLKYEDFAPGYSLERIARKINPQMIGDEPSRPVLCMVCIGEEYAKTVEAGTQSKVEYCKRHGYGMAILDEVPYRYDRPPAWLKIPLIFRLMQMGRDRLFFVDADTVITNPGIPLEAGFGRLEKAERHLMIAEDLYTLNTGAFFIRRTWQAQALLDLIYESDAEVEHGFWEQQALIRLVEQYGVIRSLLYLEPDSRQFNSMPFEGPRASHWPSDYMKYAWQPGDFLCHFAGNRNKSDLADKMAAVLQRASAQAVCSKLEGAGK